MNSFLDEEREAMAHTYNRQPILIVEGKGAIVKDTEGREYIDLFSGIAVNNVGHCHPRVVKAVQDQTSSLMHTSNIYYTKPQLELARILFDATGGYLSFFCNSGAEAVEAAIKLVRKIKGACEIITAKGSFHGRTLGALAATGQSKYRSAFEPLPEGFTHVNYGEAGAIEENITSTTGAVMLEPIQGEGGVIVPPAGYFNDVERLCRQNDLLLVLDEVQTGFGRTGSLFAWQHLGIEPDIFTAAKALGGGLPIGATLAKKGIMKSFEPGDHASTFGGNPVACAAAAASTRVILEENLSQRAQEVGAYLMKKLRDLKTKHPIIEDVRGRGLLIGVELSVPCQPIVDRGRDRGVLLNCVGAKVLRIAPPLNIERELIDRAVSTLDTLFGEAHP